LNVGTIHGGTGINVLAAEAVCELDLRSEAASELRVLTGQVEELIRSANREGVKVEAKLIGQRPAGRIPAEHPFIKLGTDSLREQGIEIVLTSGSTDANIPLSRGAPALVLGVTTGGGAHTMNEYIDVEPIKKGMEQLVRFVERAWG
jgi:acetylornithine deacetylase/succinyl-diaminopimelate desuccinylase-like protein